MNRANRFRSVLAEQGIEMTPDQAREAYRMARKLRKVARRLSMEDFWVMEEDETLGMPREERLQMIELYRVAQEI